MHGIGSVAGADDGLASVDLDALAAMHQGRRIMFVAKDLREPVAQAGFFLLEALMFRDDLVFALLERMIEFGDDADVVRDKPARAQRFLGGIRQMHQHQPDPEIVRAALDLGKTVCGR